MTDEVILWILGTLIATLTATQFALWAAVWALYRAQNQMLLTLSREYHTKEELREAVKSALVPFTIEHRELKRSVDFLVTHVASVTGIRPFIREQSEREQG